MFNILLQGVVKFVSQVASALIQPIATMILNLFPSVSQPLSYVSGFLNYLKQFVPFAFSYLGLTAEVKAILISLATSLITIPIAVHVIKLAIRWYNALKI